MFLPSRWLTLLQQRPQPKIGVRKPRTGLKKVMNGEVVVVEVGDNNSPIFKLMNVGFDRSIIVKFCYFRFNHKRRNKKL